MPDRARLRSLHGLRVVRAGIGELDELAEDVVRARVRFLDPGNVLGAAHDDVVGEALGRASSSSTLDIAKPMWMSPQSPGFAP